MYFLRDHGHQDNREPGQRSRQLLSHNLDNHVDTSGKPLSLLHAHSFRRD